MPPGQMRTAMQFLLVWKLASAVDAAENPAAEIFGRKSRLFVKDRGTGEEHKEHLKIVFERLQQCGLRINISKSVMGADRIEYLGFLITAEGSRPLPEKVEAIINYKLPSIIHDLRTFLGLINFYRRYLKDAAKTQAALHELLKGAKKKDRRKVPWTDDTRRNFEKYGRFSVVLIDLIDPLPPSEGMEYCLTCIDRYSSGIEAVLLPAITAEIVGKAFYNNWICRFGVPAQIIMDQGRQFESQLLRCLAAICGAKVSHTTPYHP
ncbi:retrovirus-related Pol polyprotein from transposon opus [Nephila pilipes]|uniref:Retrovirus-related Pol polyprotein from transposon opus n=1 Tax=Nephila pilipes TaxID=299642 RepID=A0A8X6NY76_NEPPI|nr:retrovirus-related Pol polyprotein from transposon opus [Nephila pilipes]GFT41588.1 retrovirus-related Pol polyprotein from transposon opus [Nephila pilipes]GFT60823.1 retrovirus-related Pol polyprotein from transposon opus [Nephila pilipes]GFU20677.1 retrovirus-related Pol polyprotein from transposon opus [Nephila pilipes]